MMMKRLWICIALVLLVLLSACTIFEQPSPEPSVTVEEPVSEEPTTVDEPEESVPETSVDFDIPDEDEPLERPSSGGGSGGGGGGSSSGSPSTPSTSPNTPTGPTPQPSSLGVTDPFASFSLPSLAYPALGVSFNDPVFKTSLRRVGDAPGDQERHEYSQLQAFNSDSSLIMLNGDDYVVKDLETLEIIFTLPNDINAPRWNPANPNEVYYFDSNDVGSGNTRVVLQKSNVRTGAQTDVFTFPVEYERVSPAISWEELSRDGKWITAYLYKTDNSLHFVALDIENGQLGAQLPLSNGLNGHCSSTQGGPNWVAPSPLGNYMVIQWNRDGSGPCTGVESFDIRTGQYRGHVGSHRQHSDTGLDDQGNEVYVTTYFGNSVFITTTQFPGSTNFEDRYDKIILDPGWFHFDHISCKGPGGVCAVTGGGSLGDAFAGEIYLVYMSGSAQDNEQNAQARVRRIAHHRSTSCDYWAQPQASISTDGQHVVFASDWEDCNNAKESYVIDIGNPAAPEPSSTPTEEDSEDEPEQEEEEDTPPEEEPETPVDEIEETYGSNGIPTNTYTLDNNDELAVYYIDPEYGTPQGPGFVELVVENNMGTMTCNPDDFTRIRFFISDEGINDYSLLPDSAILDYRGGGCVKWNQIYKLAISRTKDIVVCASDTDLSNNYCIHRFVAEAL